MDLRDPTTSCIQIATSAGEVTLSALTADLPVNTPGHYQGSLTFPLVVSGSYSFSYSCESDYSVVTLGSLAQNVVGLSVYPGGNFVVVVTKVTPTSSGVVLSFEAAGASDLDQPDSSCLETSTTHVTGIGHVATSMVTATAAMLAGVVDFSSTDAGGFSYDCGQYPTIPVG